MARAAWCAQNCLRCCHDLTMPYVRQECLTGIKPTSSSPSAPSSSSSSKSRLLPTTMYDDAPAKKCILFRYTGTTVDPNFTNIQKLPRASKSWLPLFSNLQLSHGRAGYAQFGKLSGDADVGQGSTATTTASSASTSQAAPATDFKPTRRVREPPGGSHSNIFQYDGEDDALAYAPPKPTETTTAVGLDPSATRTSTQR